MWRFAANIKISSKRYLRLTYSPEEIVNGISDIRELERDVEAIEDSVSQSEGRMSWSWDEAPPTFFCRWQTDAKIDMRDETPLF